ncbi:hypothetical protein C2E23DRAFT_860967 [Lenzites betulinus]|nr:hypothetical protein C2E23DRAFT_860967 [Lenzites betulinus]
MLFSTPPSLCALLLTLLLLAAHTPAAALSIPRPSSSRRPRALVETAYAGHIVARYTGADAAVAGSVRASASGVTLGGDADGAHITFATAGPRALFSISSLGAVEIGTDTTSFIGASGTAALGAGSPSAVLLNSVPQTSAHARPATTGSESAIWLFDASTGALTAHWVNPDGSHPRTRVAARARDGALVLTGDVAAYNAAAPGPGDVVREVTLHFVSD